jgi:hypothetical protein
MILPIEFSGAFYILANNPIFWALQPILPGEDCKVISILFEEEDFQFFEGPDIDKEMMENMIKQEIENEERKIETHILKEEEAKKFRDEQNAKIEALRKNHLQ